MQRLQIKSGGLGDVNIFLEAHYDHVEPTRTTREPSKYNHRKSIYNLSQFQDKSNFVFGFTT